ncbi:MAG: Fur family transcriptional regulator [Thainema sp.]
MFRSLLNQEGFRFTIQRQRILDLFKTCDEGQHLSAEEIHQYLSTQGASVSLSTIYRALHVMVDLNLLRELELAEGKKYYELSVSHSSNHHHLVCVECGAVVEFEEDLMAQIGSSQTETRGYALLDCQFTIYGICPKCQ